LPVIAAKNGAHLETVGAVSTRWLYEPGNHAQLSSMMDTVATDEGERDRYGQALQAHQRLELSLDAHLDRLEAEYEKVRG